LTGYPTHAGGQRSPHRTGRPPDTRHNIVVAVGPDRAHGELEVQLCRRKHGHSGRRAHDAPMVATRACVPSLRNCRQPPSGYRAGRENHRSDAVFSRLAASSLTSDRHTAGLCRCDGHLVEQGEGVIHGHGASGPSNPGGLGAANSISRTFRPPASRSGWMYAAV
jgi:hypothetical protein